MEIEDSLSKDFNEFIPGITPFIGRNCHNSMKIITFCRICSIEINKVLLYEHINSKEHKENEDYLIVMGMTYCEVCIKEIRNDEWRDHITSKEHLLSEDKYYCELCKKKYPISKNEIGTFDERWKKAEYNHKYKVAGYGYPNEHQQREERLKLYSQ